MSLREGHLVIYSGNVFPEGLFMRKKRDLAIDRASKSIKVMFRGQRDCKRVAVKTFIHHKLPTKLETIKCQNLQLKSNLIFSYQEQAMVLRVD